MERAECEENRPMEDDVGRRCVWQLYNVAGGEVVWSINILSDAGSKFDVSGLNRIKVNSTLHFEIYLYNLDSSRYTGKS